MIASLLVPLLLQSAPPDPAWNCEAPRVQQEMNWCAGQDFAAADAAMNAQWRLTREAMKARDTAFAAQGGADRRKGWSASLLEAQRGWLRFRDAQCALEGYGARGGSLEPLLVASCKARLTRARTGELKALTQDPG